MLINSHTHRCGCLCDDWCLKISSRADLCKLVQLRDVTLEVFTASTDPTHTHAHAPSSTHTHDSKDIHTQHTTQHSPSIQKSLEREREKTLKNSHRWCFTPRASCHEPICAALLAPPRPISLFWLSEVDGVPEGLFLLLLNCRCVYRKPDQCPVDTSVTHFLP